jgi:hypothetical protein
MKNYFGIACCSIAISIGLNAQVPAAMSSDAIDFYNKAFTVIKPQIKTFINRKSISINYYSLNVDSLKQSFKKEIKEKLANTDLDGIIVLVMVQASQNTDGELKELVMAVSRGDWNRIYRVSSAKAIGLKTNESKALTKGELEEFANQRLQALMNRKSRLALEINYLMNKIEGFQTSIISHLK